MRTAFKSIQFCILPVMQVARLFVLLILSTIPSFCQNESSCSTFNEEKCLKVAALIPARAGSKGIKNKNLSILGNHTLLARTLRAIHESRIFDSVWVLTDGSNISEEAIKHGAKIHWRDPQTATDNASTVSAVEDFILKKSGYDIVAVVQCTSPFLKNTFLIKALDIMLKSEADCVFSVTKSHQLRWTERSNGFATPINFDPKNRPRRQNWKGELVENGMFYFVKPILVLKNKVLQNERCKTVEVPKEFSLEIDTYSDLEVARIMLAMLQNF